MNRRVEPGWTLPLAIALAMALACVSPRPARSSDRPRLAVELIDPDPFDGDDERQAKAINAELNELERHLPGIDVDANLWPQGEFDFRLSGLVMDNRRTDLALTARYEGPDDFEDNLTGRFRDPCREERERERACERLSIADRASAVVADLLDQTLINWSTGIYRPFDVVRCERQTLQQVSVKLASTSVVKSYQDPDSWFRYRPSVLHENASVAYPEPLELLLERRSKQSNGFIVFVRRHGVNEAFDRFCPGHETEPPDGAREKIVLEHRYPGPDLLEASAPPRPVALNAAAPPNLP
jgi:hypothetical protein